VEFIRIIIKNNNKMDIVEKISVGNSSVKNIKIIKSTRGGVNQ